MATAIRDQDAAAVLEHKIATANASFRLGSHKTALAAESFERIVTLTEVFLDAAAALLAVVISERLQLSWALPLRNNARGWLLGLMVAIVAVFMLEKAGAYRRGTSLLRVKETERALRVVTQLWTVAGALFIYSHDFAALGSVTITALLLAILLVSEKHLVHIAVRSLHASGKGVRRAVILGAGYTGRRVFGAIVRSPKLGLDPVLMVDHDPRLEGQRIYAPSYWRERSLAVTSGPITAELLRRERAGAVIIAIPSIDNQKLSSIVEEATRAGARTAFVPNRSTFAGTWIEHADIDGLLISSIGQPSEHPIYACIKRVFDLFFAATILLVTCPLWLVFVLAIRIESRGPAIFVQRRVGKNGKVFHLYKFRSMYTDAPTYCYSPKDQRDSRITRVGRFLRRTSLDELPQLLNVIKGEMSLVGPRPEMPFIVAEYETRHWQRLRVKPGITGLWQLSADRAFLIHENLDYDLYYIRNRGFFMDLAILMHTFFFAMRGI